MKYNKNKKNKKRKNKEENKSKREQNKTHKINKKKNIFRKMKKEDDSYSIRFKHSEDFIDAQDLYAYCNYLVFKSFNNIFYLVYATESNSIIYYNIEDKSKIIEIKNCHKNSIYLLKYISDDINKRILVLSLSSNNDLKVWNSNNFECILNLENINLEGKYFTFSACFIKENNKIYIGVSDNGNNVGPLKVFNLEGNLIKKINNGGADYIESYFDEKLSNNYLLSSSLYSLESYDFKSNKRYKLYEDLNDVSHPKTYLYYYKVFSIYNDDNITKLIGFRREGAVFFQVWNFHSGEKLKKIVYKNYFYINDACLWNNQYLLITYAEKGEDMAGKEDNYIKLINLKNGEIVKDLIKFPKFYLFFVKKFIHPSYGECLLTFGYDYIIKLWKLK